MGLFFPVVVPDPRIKAFNQGCDARLCGFSKKSNPYNSMDGLYKVWLQGWVHADKHWGRDANWNVCPLPPVGN